MKKRQRFAFILYQQNTHEDYRHNRIKQCGMGAFCSAFLGYKLDKDFLNKGYMSMAVEMLTKYAFEN